MSHSTYKLADEAIEQLQCAIESLSHISAVLYSLKQLTSTAAGKDYRLHDLASAGLYLCDDARSMLDGDCSRLAKELAATSEAEGAAK